MRCIRLVVESDRTGSEDPFARRAAPQLNDLEFLLADAATRRCDRRTQGTRMGLSMYSGRGRFGGQATYIIVSQIDVRITEIENTAYGFLGI
jgi:hypothetical protein